MGVGSKLLTLGIVGVAGYSFYKGFKEDPKVETVNNNNQSDKNAELFKDRKNNEVVKNEIIKNLYANCLVDLSDDVLDPIEGYNGDHTIMISQESNGDVKVSFTIPNLVKTKSLPKISDYIRCISEKIGETRLRKSLKGYLYLYPEDDNKDEEEFFLSVVQIPKEFYKDWAEDNRDGLTSFYNSVYKNDRKALSTLLNFINSLDIKSGNYELVLRFDLTLFDKDENTITEFIKSLVNTEVTNSFNNSVNYDHVLFLAPNPEGIWDEKYYYNRDEETGDIIVMK